MVKEDIKIGMNVVCIKVNDEGAKFLIGLSGSVTTIKEKPFSDGSCIEVAKDGEEEVGWWFSPEELELVKDSDCYE